MPNPIAVPHDGSPASDRALPVAVAFARVLGAPLRLIRLFEVRDVGVGAIASDPGVSLMPADYLGQPPRATVARELARLVAEVERVHGVAATGDLGEATDVGRALLDRIARLEPPLVVMATRGATGLARALLGSVADAVVRESGVPVVLVPPLAREETAYPLRRVLIALDGEPAGEEIVTAAAALMRGTRAAVTLLSVVQPTLVSGVSAPEPLRDPVEGWIDDRVRGEYLEPIAARLRGEGHEARPRVVEGTDACREILAEARAAGVDLIAMATHGRHGLRRLARGSVADGVVKGAEVPVMLLRPPGWVVPPGVPSPAP